MAIYSGFTYWKWWFSIAMLVYQRVYIYIYLSIYLSISTSKNHTSRWDLFGFGSGILWHNPHPVTSLSPRVSVCSKTLFQGWLMTADLLSMGIVEPTIRGQNLQSCPAYVKWCECCSTIMINYGFVNSSWAPTGMWHAATIYIYICINQTIYIYIYTYKRVKYWTSPMS